ncbi:MAG TPA: DUF2589 domain-containing protein [Clostridia bacterium]|nr:DUF2589 domain-containing protein [Clostridia bacterium]
MANPGQELSSLDFKNIIGGPLIAVVEAQAQAALSSVNFIKSVGFKPGNSQDPEAQDTGEPIYVTFKYPKEVMPYQPATPATFSINVTAGGSGYSDNPSVSITGGGGSGAQAKALVEGGVIKAINITNPGTGYNSAPSVSITDESGSDAEAEVSFTASQSAQPAQYSEMKLEVPILTMLPIPFIRIDETTLDFNVKINSMEYKQVDTQFKIDAALEAKARWGWGSAKLNVSTSYQRNTTQGEKVERTYSMNVHVRAVQEELPAGLEKVLGILEDAIKSQPA